MSHVHNLSGNATAAAEYQEYLARLAADRRLREGRGRKQLEVKTFDSAIETDPESEDDGDQPEGEAADGEPESPPAEDPTEHTGFSIKA